MTNWLAGMEITAARLADGIDPETTTTGLTAGTDFTVNSFSGRRSGKVVTVHCYLAYTGADVNQTNTNISDRTIATLPSGWRPTETINAVVGQGTWIGECTIASTGVISLRAISYNMTTANPNLRVTATWIDD